MFGLFKSKPEVDTLEKEYASTRSKTITNAMVVQAMEDYSIRKGLTLVDNKEFKDLEYNAFSRYNKEQEIYLGILLVTRGSFNSPSLRYKNMYVNYHYFAEDCFYVSYPLSIHKDAKYVKVSIMEEHLKEYAELFDSNFYKDYIKEFGRFLTEEERKDYARR